MNYKKSYFLFWILFALGAITGILPFTGAMVVGSIIIAVAIVQRVVFFRCPNCNKAFDRAMPQHCPHCGIKLD